MALPDFQWLKETAGSYVHPGLANAAKSIFDKKPPRGKNTGISSVIAQFNKGFARPNLFEVDIARVGAAGKDQSLFRLGCFQAQLPGTNIATTDPKDIGFRAAAYQKIYSDIILGFYCSGDLTELNFFQEWMNDIVDPTTNHIGYYRNYISTIKIAHINRQDSGDRANGEKIATWTLHEAYPKTIDPIQLDYGTTDTVMIMNVSMTYRHVTHEWHKMPDSDVFVPSQVDPKLVNKNWGKAGGAALNDVGLGSIYGGGPDMGPSEY